MRIELTDAQQRAVSSGEPIRISRPELGRDVVPCRAEVFETLRELIEDERQQKPFREAGLRSAIRWMRDDPC